MWVIKRMIILDNIDNKTCVFLMFLFLFLFLFFFFVVVVVVVVVIVFVFVFVFLAKFNFLKTIIPPPTHQKNI